MWKMIREILWKWDSYSDVWLAMKKNIIYCCKLKSKLKHLESKMLILERDHTYKPDKSETNEDWQLKNSESLF